jgi:MoaE-MoaD fusion protein
MALHPLGGPLKVTVRLFARYAEALGAERVEVTLSSPATVADVLRALRAEVPAASALPARPLCAINLDHALPSTPVTDGAEVALLPPLAGG